MSRRNAIFLVIFLLYAAVRMLPNLAAMQEPRQRADTAVFIEMSKRGPLSAGLWAGERPPTYPIYLKVADRSLLIASAFQAVLSTLCWGALALVVASFLRSPTLQVGAFAWLLLVSLTVRLAGWDFSIMSESLSLSLMVLFIALGLWLVREWNLWKAAALVVTAFFFAFVRDTNAYLLLTLAVLLGTAALLGWARGRTLTLAGLFAVILLLSNASADGGGRWVFPLINILGQRVLTLPRSINIIQRVCDMPVSPALMGMRNEFANGQVEAFYNDPALKEFRTWLLEEGKGCYPRLLISDPAHSLRQPLEQFDDITAFRRVRSFYAHNYDPPLPALLEPLLYPVWFPQTLWVLVSLAAVAALVLEAGRYNRLWWGFVLLSLTIFPHLFITWHGEAMDPERHALTVGLQLVLSVWILVFLIADFLAARRYEPEPEGITEAASMTSGIDLQKP